MNSSEKTLFLIKLRTLCRIRGLSIDVENQKEKKFFDGAKQEMEMFLRHLLDDGAVTLKWIISDIECAKKYLNDEEKKQFKYLTRRKL